MHAAVGISCTIEFCGAGETCLFFGGDGDVRRGGVEHKAEV